MKNYLEIIQEQIDHQKESIANLDTKDTSTEIMRIVHSYALRQLLLTKETILAYERIQQDVKNV